MSCPELPNLLYVAHRLPYPPDKGDRIRSFHTLRYLASRANVHLACLTDEPPAANAIEVLQGLCGRVAVVPMGGRRWSRALASLALGETITEGAFASRRLTAIVRRWAGETRFHAALASSSGVARYLRLQPLRGVPAIVDLVDVDSQKWHEYAGVARPPLRWIYQREARLLGRVERALPQWARAITLVSEAETALYRGLYPGCHAQAVVNGVDLEYFQPMNRHEEPLTCVFVGALDYRANVEGLSWFCEKVWPQVISRRPEARFLMVGRCPNATVARLAHQSRGVELVGPVSDVRPALAAAAIVVAPLRIARGIQNKVLEALSMAKAVVASPEALEGLAVEPDRQVVSANVSSEWLAAIDSLFDQPERRQALGLAGRQFVESNHRWERCLAAWDDLLGLDPHDRERRDPAGGKPWCDGFPAAAGDPSLVRSVAR